MTEYTPTTEEVRDKYIGKGFVDGKVLEYTEFAREQIGAEFDRWLAETEAAARQNIVDHLAEQRAIAPSKRDEMFACPADCRLSHDHIARMSGDPHYWSYDD